MKIFKPAYVDNVNVLRLLKKNSLICRPYVQDICRSYRLYLSERANPARLKSLDLPKEVIDELYEFYKSERKRDGLQWIARYRTASELSHCPLCGNPGPSQLEHYLPRSPYAEFTNFSWNLIPTCGLCNGKRSNHGNSSAQKYRLIHPYFDEPIFGQSMLSARIIPPFEGVSFTPRAIGPFEPTILDRIERQVSACVKVDRFNVYLVSKWNIWRGKASVYKSVERVRDELQIELGASIGPAGKNSWDVAFLRAVLADEEALLWLVKNGLNIKTRPFPIKAKSS